MVATRRIQNRIPPLPGTDLKTGPKRATPPSAKKSATVECTFQEFFVVWAQMQVPVWHVPAIHFTILDFLANHGKWEDKRGVLQVFRGAAKSTIVGLFIVWMLTQDPTLRFLVLSADKKTAGKITMDVMNIIQRHPLAKHLHGEENVWRADALFVKGFTDARTPSVTSWGVKSNITGARADWIIYDDTEVPKNSGTETEREGLRTKLVEPTHILVPGGFELFVGTPHAYDSIYPEILGEVEKDERIRDGASALKIPVLENLTGEFPEFKGKPVWPERFGMAEVLKRARSSKTKGHFLSQYLLLPYNPDDTVLDPTLIATYTAEVSITEGNGATLAKIGDHRVMSVSAFWDPSLAKLSTDDSVLSIVYTTDDGHYFIHRTVKLEGDAEDQCSRVIASMKECEVPHVVIETNGVGAFLPAILRKAMAGTGLTCEGKATSQNKLQKIMQAYEVRLAGGYIHAHKSVMNSPFRSQLRDFSARSMGRTKDDFIDSVAMAILAQPIRIKAAHYGARKQFWGAVSQGMELEVDAVVL
jgi:hypothetical protein